MVHVSGSLPDLPPETDSQRSLDLLSGDSWDDGGREGSPGGISVGSSVGSSVSQTANR